MTSTPAADDKVGGERHEVLRKVVGKLDCDICLLSPLSMILSYLMEVIC